MPRKTGSALRYEPVARSTTGCARQRLRRCQVCGCTVRSGVMQVVHIHDRLQRCCHFYTTAQVHSLYLYTDRSHTCLSTEQNCFWETNWASLWRTSKQTSPRDVMCKSQCNSQEHYLYTCLLPRLFSYFLNNDWLNTDHKDKLQTELNFNTEVQNRVGSEITL